MEAIISLYTLFENKILHSLDKNGIKHRSKANSGLWLGCLVGLSAIMTLLKEDSSYSEICFLVGLTGIGLLTSSICLFIRLSMDKIIAKDFQVIYFLPAITTSLLYVYIANKGLLVSVTWGLTVASLGTWGILQLMSSFPGCFTIGEAIAVMHSGILFLLSTFTNLPLRYHLPPIHSNDIATVILQVGMLLVLSMCLTCNQFTIFRKKKFFYLMAISTLIFVLFPCLYILLDQDPIQWMILFIFSKRSRVILIGYWSFCLFLGVCTILFQILLKTSASSSVRKSFHILSILVYIPGLIYDQSLLYLASGITMGIFIMLELMRILKMPPLGETLQQGFSVFSDEKDNLVSLTPLYLLSGLSFPLWIPTNNLAMLPLFSGVLTVGIGDTAASFVGSKWGRYTWPGSEKTVEGTIACIMSQLVMIFFMNYFGYIDTWWALIRGILAIVIISLVEARTNQVDNLALPLLMYVCLIA